MAFTKIPALIKGKSGWTLDSFTPSQSAFRWDDFERKNATLYVLGCGDSVKIGVTRDLSRRLSQIAANNPHPVVVLAKRTVPLASLLITEAWMHQRFAAWRAHGEWFNVPAETVLADLPEAVRFAQAYARCCRDWFLRDEARRITESMWTEL